MKKRSVSLVPAFILATVCGASPGASAGEHAAESARDSRTSDTADATLAQARAAAVEGYRLLDAGRPVEALAKFEEAHGLRGGDKLRFNLGQALAAIPGREADAYREFSLYLQKVPDAPAASAAFSKKALTKLRAKIALVSFSVSPEGAEISLDGQRLPLRQTPEPVPLSPGRHLLRVENAGFAVLEKTLDLLPGQQSQQSLTLAPTVAPSLVVAPSPSVPTPPTAVPAPGPAATIATTPGPQDAPPVASSKPSPLVEKPLLVSPPAEPPGGGTSAQRTAAYVAGGVAVAALGVGGFFGVRAFSKWGEVKSNCPTLHLEACQDRVKGAADQNAAKRASLVADVGVGLGVAAAATAVVLWVRSRPAEADAVPPSPASTDLRSLSWAPSVSPGAAGLALGGAW